MIHKTLILFGIALFYAASVTASDWIIDKKTSSLTFEASQTSVLFSGQFTNFDVDVFFDPKHPETGRIKATIDITSVDAGDKQRNTALPTKEWFGLDQFPTAIFTSDTIKPADSGLYAAHGKLILKGITHPVILTFNFEETSNTAHIEATTQLNRADFGVGSGAWASGKWVSLDIQIRISLNATRKEQGNP